LNSWCLFLLALEIWFQICSTLRLHLPPFNWAEFCLHLLHNNTLIFIIAIILRINHSPIFVDWFGPILLLPRLTEHVLFGFLVSSHTIRGEPPHRTHIQKWLRRMIPLLLVPVCLHLSRLSPAPILSLSISELLQNLSWLPHPTACVPRTVLCSTTYSSSSNSIAISLLHRPG